MATKTEEQIRWIESERNLEFCRSPRQFCQFCKTHRSWGPTCKFCLAEIWHVLHKTWRRAPEIRDDS